MRWRGVFALLTVAGAVVAVVFCWHREPTAQTSPSDAVPAQQAATGQTYGPTPYLVNEKDPPIQADPELTQRLIDTMSVDSPREPVAIMLDIKKDQTTRNEAANLLRRSGYSGLTDDLIRSMGSPEEGPLWRSYCIQHLWMNTERSSGVEKEKITKVLRASLSDRHTRVRREALLALCRLKDPLGKDTATKWITAQEGEGARDVAVRCMEDLDMREQAPAIRALVASQDETTVVTAIGTLGRWHDEASRQAIEEALKSPSQRIQRAARAALNKLGGSGVTGRLN